MMSEALQAALIALGVPGIVAMVTLYVVRHMYLRIETLQELRIEEMKANLAAITANNVALAANTLALQGNNVAIQTLTTLVQQLLLKGGV